MQLMKDDSDFEFNTTPNIWKFDAFAFSQLLVFAYPPPYHKWFDK
jgi:hypothetical protein